MPASGSRFGMPGNNTCRIAIGIVLIFFAARTTLSQSRIRGSVDAYGSPTPLADVVIRVFNSNWVFLSEASTTTGTDGTFTSGTLSPGYYYLRAVPLYPQPYVASYWPEALEREEALQILVQAGIDTFGIRFDLVKGGFIRGTILRENELAVPACDLDLYTDQWKWITALTTTSGSNGDYIIGALPPGRYFLRADPAMDKYLQQRYWPQSYYREDAQLLTIYEGSDISDIDFSLPDAGLFSGKVLRDSGEPVGSCEIRVYDADWIQQPIHHAISDAQGVYQAFGLPAGQYFAEACPIDGSGDAREYYNDATNAADADLITIEILHSIPDIDFSLPEGNFDFNLDIRISSTHLTGGMPFSVDLDIRNDGTPQSSMPVFFLLELSGGFYFWPSWRLYHPPDEPFIDYAFSDLPSGSRTIPIFPEFTWPELGLPVTEAQFLSAITTRSFSSLASDVETISWSFQ